MAVKKLSEKTFEKKQAKCECEGGHEGWGCGSHKCFKFGFVLAGFYALCLVFATLFPNAYSYLIGVAFHGLAVSPMPSLGFVDAIVGVLAWFAIGCALSCLLCCCKKHGN